jgi:hypothetical protein
VKKIPKLKTDFDLEILFRNGVEAKTNRLIGFLGGIPLLILKQVKKIKYTKDKSSKEIKPVVPLSCPYHCEYREFIKAISGVTLSTPLSCSFTTIQKCLQNFSHWEQELRGSLMHDLMTDGVQNFVQKIYAACSR